MEAMRQSWTDERLDDLRDTVVGLRAENQAEFRALRAEMAAGFGQINQQFDRLFQAMIGISGVMIASLVGFIATRL